MELSEKLQELRKQKGLTQEELAGHLFVSRTAVSKWESGRGYPSIDSLKEIAKFFSVSIDELLSSEQALIMAKEENKQKESRFCDLVFGLLDVSVAMFFFMPLFGQRVDEVIQGVSLLSLNETALFLRIGYYILVIAMVVVGVLILALQNSGNELWVKAKHKISCLLSMMGMLLFVISTQPYAAVFLFVFLMIKVFLLMKRQ
jgi:transcriptional regulator with XRE-family HTH domain